MTALHITSAAVLPRLFSQFILRRMAQERTRTLTTIIGVALGIAVVIAAACRSIRISQPA